MVIAQVRVPRPELLVILENRCPVFCDQAMGVVYVAGYFETTVCVVPHENDSLQICVNIIIFPSPSILNAVVFTGKTGTIVWSQHSPNVFLQLGAGQPY